MIIVRNRFIPPSGFSMLNFLGLILFVKKNYKITDESLNHEKIHSAQYKELWYIGFFILYGFYWIKNIIKDSNNAYRNIPFEKEAYVNEHNLDYLSMRRKFAWRYYT